MTTVKAHPSCLAVSVILELKKRSSTRATIMAFLVAGRRSKVQSLRSKVESRKSNFYLGSWTLDLGLWTFDLGLWTFDFGPWTFDLRPWSWTLIYLPSPKAQSFAS